MLKNLLLLLLATPLFSQNLWEPTEYIWNIGIASMCDIGLDKDPNVFFSRRPQNKVDLKNLDNLVPGQVVWMPPPLLEPFCQNYLNQLKHPIVLVVSGGDRSFPNACQINIMQLISNEKILHIFAQNCEETRFPWKITHLPIGINFHSRGMSNGAWAISPTEQERELKEILSSLKPTRGRKLKAFVDFHLNDSIRNGAAKRYRKLGEDRTSIFNQIFPSGMIDYTPHYIPRTDLWQIKGEYAFSVSPHGNGLDCHRTWEDLVLGCIVIVKTSPLDPMYKGLPVVIVKDWSEITEQNMKKWLEQYGDAFENPAYREKLTNAYWMNKIREATRASQNGDGFRGKRPSPAS